MGSDDYITEAEALYEISDCCEEPRSFEEWKEDREHSILGDWLDYENNKRAKVGDMIVCAENRCRRKFKKKSYQQAFCCTKHKNQFWNRQRLIK